MSNIVERRLKLKEILRDAKMTVAPSCFNPLSARLIESVGFNAVHVSGSSLSRFAGYSDIGLLDLSEMVKIHERIVEAVNIPAIGDAETGFGGPVHTVRTVRAYERAGVAGIHIEDELTPKKSGGGPGSHFAIPLTEMVEKLKAAVDARTDQSFVIVARSNARDCESFAQVTERVAAYSETGADAIWPGVRLREELEKISEFTTLPLVGVPPRPAVSLEAYERCGFKVACIPSILGQAATYAMWDLLEIFKKTGSDETFWQKHPNADRWRRWFNEMGKEEEEKILKK